MRRSVMFLIFVIVVVLLIPQKDSNREFVIDGLTMGTISYSVKFIYDKEIVDKNSIDSILINFNDIFSTYINNSEISRINRSIGRVEVSESFLFLLKQSKIIFNKTSIFP